MTAVFQDMTWLQVAALCFSAVLIGAGVILLLVAFLISMLRFVSSDFARTFSLWQIKFCCLKAEFCSVSVCKTGADSISARFTVLDAC